LEKHGFAVVSAADGVRGIELALSIAPHIILLDIQLPQLDGYEIARTLRTHDALRSAPIVAVTSYAMPGDRERALAAGCDGYIEKPINPDTFVADVTKYLSSNSSD
jgi:CheY-like chemotaxis protein